MRRIGLFALLSLSLIGSAQAHNYCHPKEELVLRLNDDAGYCQILPDGRINKVADQATWVLFEYTASDEPRTGECESGTQYLSTDWYYGGTCPEQWKLERLQAVRKQLLHSRR